MQETTPIPPIIYQDYPTDEHVIIHAQEVGGVKNQDFTLTQKG